MSLIRQVWLLIALTLTLALAGALVINVQSARAYLGDELQQKNADSAQTMALALGQLGTDTTELELALAAQFDTGHYAMLRLVGAGGQVLVERQAERRVGTAPGWFTRGFGVESELGVAQVSSGWSPLGRLEVRSQSAFANDELWRSVKLTVLMLTALALLAGWVALLGVRRMRRPLEATVAQAEAIAQRRFYTVSEPRVPELRQVTRAMNGMVTRVQAMFEEQVGQVESLRRAATCDSLTGALNRAHFMARLRVVLEAEDGAAEGLLLLVRLGDLQEVNRRNGRQVTDDLLRAVAEVLLATPGTQSSVVDAGRLNGADFALLLPHVTATRDAAQDIAARLRGRLQAMDPEAAPVLGAVRWWHGAAMSGLLAAADQALARAEAHGAYAVEIDDAGEGLVMGEQTWRSRIERALSVRDIELGEYPLLGADGSLIHLECPLRLRFQPGEAPVPAAQWLPMAQRANLTVVADLAAAASALQRIASDGVPRSVNLSPSSLADGDFASRLQDLLAAHVGAAPGLWVEVAQDGAMRHVPAMRELAALMHARGARIGLEHAGARLDDASDLLHAGLDFVKLDASVMRGVAGDPARWSHVEGLVRTLHGIGLAVYGEGVDDEMDALALWRCRVDGLTGPWMSEHSTLI